MHAGEPDVAGAQTRSPQPVPRLPPPQTRACSCHVTGGSVAWPPDAGHEPLGCGSVTMNASKSPGKIVSHIVSLTMVTSSSDPAEQFGLV